MDVRNWSVVVIETNKFEAQLVVDLLRNAGVDKIKVFTDSEAAMDTLEVSPANIIICSLESTPIAGVAWTRAFRRNMKAVSRKSAIFITSRAFSRSIAEDCRHGGANALIGKPLSGKVLMATIQKVLGAPRPFIDAAGYVGPCRRAGIVTAGAPKKRRKADEQAAVAETLGQTVAKLSGALAELVAGTRDVASCQAALHKLQAYAVHANDQPMMVLCQVLATQLSQPDLKSDLAKIGIKASSAALQQLVGLEAAQTAEREAVAAGLRQTMTKIAAAAAAKAA
ncbi:hypothetical protein [Terricaulis sp.]|uniref:hypothetical protein n=1 Tax=Terricaulis sp. TaxID=2768686 RepID=UPI003784C333